MQLSEEQQSVVTGWINAGMGLSEIQKQLESEFGIRMTYMDVRFMVDDLELELKTKGPTFDKPKVDDALDPDASPAAPGKVSVSLDKVTPPNALVSGQVTFSDGVRAQWQLDQMGRLSLNASDPEYRPSEEDLQDFQNELSEAVRKSGRF